MLKGKKIVLGITGSIAAYKSCLIIRELIKSGAEVQVVITPAGKEFITPITLSTLTHKPVVSEFFSQKDGTWNSHVDLGLWADAMVIAPCTAATLGKMANGVADNMLITTYLSMKAPVFIAPAMDLDMYKHASTQKNIRTLRSFGNHIIEPGSGFLASGLEGKGRMEEPENIVKALADFFSTSSKSQSYIEDLKDKKILITAGPTYEKIDPVRFIGNYSSGKMGFALAEECSRRGAKVVLVAGPVSLTCSESIQRVDVESCKEMYEAAVGEFPNCDAAILCAAVADFRPEEIAEQKIKRVGDDLLLKLKPTQDIAATIGTMKGEGQRIVAFALETNEEESNAQRKLEKKNADFIVLNSTRIPGTTFQADDNQISIINKEGKRNQRQKWLVILLTSLFLFSNGELSAQELNAKVTVNHNQIQGTDASVFENLQQTLEQFINTRQWTHYQFQRNERINCNFNITVSKYDPGSNLFTCSALIQANRPVYNAAYSSTLYNNQDGDFNFTFAQFDQIEFNEENIDNQLTALIAYYAYLIIGLDLDSFSPMGGEDILQRDK